MSLTRFSNFKEHSLQEQEPFWYICHETIIYRSYKQRIYQIEEKV